MIDGEYIWQEFEKRGLISGVDHDEFSRTAKEIARKKGIDLPHYVYLNHGDESPQVWAPETKDGKDSWNWIYLEDDVDEEFSKSEIYYIHDNAQKRLKWLLEIFDIPEPIDTDIFTDLEEIVF